jgi:hypothetical protein
MPRQKLALNLTDFLFQAVELCRQSLKGRPGGLWQTQITFVCQAADKFCHLPRPLRGDNPKFGEVPTDGIQDHRTLSHHKVTRPVQHKNTLLLLGLHGHEPHVRPCDSLADGFRICGIVLLLLTYGFT